jgi:hypothetical protein
LKFKTARKALEFYITQKMNPSRSIVQMRNKKGIVSHDTLLIAVADIEKMLETMPEVTQALLLAWAIDGKPQAIKAAQKEDNKHTGNVIDMNTHRSHNSLEDRLNKGIRDISKRLEDADYLSERRVQRRKVAA